MTAEQLFNSYQQWRAMLPEASFESQPPQGLSGIVDLASSHQAFVFDAYGVLNQGDQAIPGAAEAIRQLQQQGKQVLVLTNSGAMSKLDLVRRLAGLGFDFRAEHIISSRDALEQALANWPEPKRWGAILPDEASLQGLPAGSMRLSDPEFYQADGFLFMSSQQWTAAEQQLLHAALLARPRPVLLANPDIMAPYPQGFKAQPGHFVLNELPRELHPWVTAFGKPHQAVYELVKQQLQGISDWQQVVMVGDTLHTDVLGGRKAGFSTCLVTGQGALTGLDLQDCYATSGLWPDYVLTRI